MESSLFIGGEQVCWMVRWRARIRRELVSRILSVSVWSSVQVVGTAIAECTL